MCVCLCTLTNLTTTITSTADGAQKISLKRSHDDMNFGDSLKCGSYTVHLAWT